MNTIPPIDQFKDLIHKHAMYCFRRLPAGTGFDYDDLVAEGNLTYCKTREIYKPEKAKFITIFHYALVTTYGSILRKGNNRRLLQTQVDDHTSLLSNLIDTSSPTIHGHLNDTFFERLTRPAAMFIRELLYSSNDYLEWEKSSFKYQAHRAKSKLSRVARFLQLTGGQTAEIVRELREKLTDSETIAA